jgi:hypothetical protein
MIGPAHLERERARSWLEGMKCARTSLAHAYIDMQTSTAEANGRDQEKLGLQADETLKCFTDMDKGLKSEKERLERLAAE